jgi:hypothetical protein
MDSMSVLSICEEKCLARKKWTAHKQLPIFAFVCKSNELPEHLTLLFSTFTESVTRKVKTLFSVSIM